MSNPGKVCFSFVPGNNAKNVSAINYSQTTKEQANTILVNKIKKNGFFFRVLVVKFVNKRVKIIRLRQTLNHATMKYRDVSYMKHKPEQHKHITEFHPQLTSIS